MFHHMHYLAHRKRPAGEVARQAGPAVRKPAQIVDFGEHIPGARKELASQAMKAGYEADPGFQGRLSDSWPKPDWILLEKQDLLNGTPPDNLAFIRTLRDGLKMNWGKVYERYQATAKQNKGSLRQLAMAVMNGRRTVTEALETLYSGKTPPTYPCKDLYTLYREVGHQHDLSHFWILTRKGENDTISGYSIFQSQENKYYVVGAKTVEEACAALKAELDKALTTAGGQRKNFPFEMFCSRGSSPRVYTICRKVSGHWVDVMEFETEEEIKDVFCNQQHLLEQWWERWRKIPESRRPLNARRTPAATDGTSNPDRFLERFRFRGVQFGNWVGTGRRESDLTEASQALTDLALALDWPVSALALNGRLGLAFGARGQGGKNAAKAHYEPDTRVIALSKPAGPGSLAHEWFHGFDHHVAAITHLAGFSYATQNTEPRAPATRRNDLQDILREYGMSLAFSGMKNRAAKLDLRRPSTKPYWSTTIEMAARTFEAWVAHKLAQKGIRNDYLVNYVRPNKWTGDTELAQDYPYPTEEELVAFARTIERIAVVAKPPTAE